MNILTVGIRVLLDFVPNHTSNEHEWFVKSVQKIEPYTDYYVWVDPKYVNGTRQEPNNWVRTKSILIINSCLSFLRIYWLTIFK